MSEQAESSPTDHERGYPTIQDAWVWPDRVERLFREEQTGNTLHVCCGKSDVGNVTLDADPRNDPDIVGDMFDLPFDGPRFDTVICDPPWKEIQHVGKKHKLFFELLRVANPGAVILWNAYSLPNSEQATLEQLWVRQDYEEGKASVIGKYRNMPDQQVLGQTAIAPGRTD